MIIFLKIRAHKPARRLELHEAIAELMKEVPIRRLGRAGEIAQAVLWLSSPTASFISRAKSFIITGGMTLGLAQH